MQKAPDPKAEGSVLGGQAGRGRPTWSEVAQ
jgi:hypothetical protein